MSAISSFTFFGALCRMIAASVMVMASVLTLSSANAWPSFTRAGYGSPPVSAPAIVVDWQGPLSLPPRFRNHCSYDVDHGRWYCANHCGADYQFYFCSQASFGCCRLGYGYCDWKGHLRCAP